MRDAFAMGLADAMRAGVAISLLAAMYVAWWGRIGARRRLWL